MLLSSGNTYARDRGVGHAESNVTRAAAQQLQTYSHCGEQHLQRYLTEFGFRYNHRKITDTERAEKALEGIAGKRLTYRRPDETEIG